MDDLIAPIAGGLLIAIGLSFVAAHFRAWKRRQQALDLDDSERFHLARRFRRRMLASALLAVIGVLIVVGYALPVLEQEQILGLLYWMGVLLLTLFVLLLAIGDYFAIRTHGNAAMARLRRQQAELERQLEELRRHGSNGRDSRG